MRSILTAYYHYLLMLSADDQETTSIRTPINTTNTILVCTVHITGIPVIYKTCILILCPYTSQLKLFCETGLQGLMSNVYYIDEVHIAYYIHQTLIVSSQIFPVTITIHHDNFSYKFQN